MNSAVLRQLVALQNELDRYKAVIANLRTDDSRYVEIPMSEGVPPLLADKETFIQALEPRILTLEESLAAHGITQDDVVQSSGPVLIEGTAEAVDPGMTNSEGDE